MKQIWAIGMVGVLAGCMAGEPVGYISAEARAALPAGTDLTTVWRRDDGCYFIQTEDELSGYLTRVKDKAGQQVCDDEGDAR